MVSWSNLLSRSLFDRAARRVRWEAYIGAVNLRWSMWDLLGMTGARPHSTVHESWEHAEPLPQAPFGGRAEPRQLLVEEFRGECLIEPEFGYLINGHSVPQRALPRSDLSRAAETMCFFSGVPSLPRYALTRLGRTQVRREKRVISLRGLFDFNYYHALTENLAKLPILDRHVPASTPIVISTTLAGMPFFQALKTLPSLRDRNWIVQDGFYVAADEIWVCGVLRPSRATLHGLLGLIGGAPEASGVPRRIFLTRNRTRGRSLRNFEKLLPVLDAGRLEIVDTENMSIFEQMELFAQAEVVVGIHGAGLTNLVFRGGRPTKLLEIFPPHDADPSFYLLAKDLGYDWHYVVGQNPSSKERHADFELDPGILARGIERLETST
jgi:glycosyl transferase family 61